MKRRRFIAQAAGMLALPIATAARAQATLESRLPAVRELTAGAPIRVGRVTLDLPLLSDNGNSVSLHLAVASPMTESDYVRSLHLYAERNPRPNVANFFFSPQSGRAEIASRIRLAGSQRVLAVARMSDGSFWGATADVVVTVSACMDES
jgi:sulfur-oxidizing protein SoxY